MLALHHRHDALRWLALGVLACGLTSALAQGPAGELALRDRHASVLSALANSEFGRALHVDSSEDGESARGDVYAVVEHRFQTLAQSLAGAANWCEVLILHLNVKQCRATPAPGAARVVVHIGTKHAQALESATRVAFDFAAPARHGSSYLYTGLSAARGPFGTRDFRITLEAMPVEPQRTFVHLSYAYRFGALAKLAMQGYLATIGRDKVGFGVVGYGPDGTPTYTGGLRGVVERNAMRYFLALDVYLDSLELPQSARVEWRLRRWFAATERHPRQLREVGEREYLEMKRAQLPLELPAAASP